MYYNLWVASLIVGFILLTLSILLAFIFKVPELLDELSGRKAKRQIKKLKEINKGTGSLDGGDFSTTDFYQSVSSGFLISKEVVKEQEKVTPVELKTKTIATGRLKANSADLEDGEVTTSLNENEDITNLLNTGREEIVEVETGHEEGTTALKEESTSFMDADEVTSFLSELEEFSTTKHSVTVIVEQSSITIKEETE